MDRPDAEHPGPFVPCESRKGRSYAGVSLRRDAGVAIAPLAFFALPLGRTLRRTWDRQKRRLDRTVRARVWAIARKFDVAGRDPCLFLQICWLSTLGI